MTVRRSAWSATVTAFLALACSAIGAQAQISVENFYRGKQIQLRIGTPAGSGYDIAGRLVAAHLGKYIPGHPNIIVQNVPGAGSLTLANQLYNTAARDGTVLGMVTNGLPTAPLLTPETTHFDLAQFGWIGSPAPETMMVMVWHTAPVQTIEDLLKTELVVGGVSPGTATVDNPLVANAVLGTKFKLVAGYEGTTAIDLAMERGEVQGHGGIGWVTVKARNQRWLAEKKVRIIAQYGMRKHPELQDVPLFELPKDELARQEIFVMFARQEYGRPLLAPPGVPPDRLAALRTAFLATMKDPDFIREAQRATVEINPTTGEELNKLSAQIIATKPAALEKLRKVLDPAQMGK
jgi:tripartite-type tricarboxylate transporter receptor subunit TctC